MTKSEHHLFVPINVEAFCVNAKMQACQFFPPLTHLEDLPYAGDGYQYTRPFLSESVISKPLHAEALDPQDHGVHLHWAMPDALMHGEQEASEAKPRLAGKQSSGAVRFPRLPDRWLVTRTQLSGSGAGQAQEWVVDSRVLSDKIDTGNRGSIAVPWGNDNPSGMKYGEKPFRFLGRTLPLAQWTPPEGDKVLSELTAASLGFLQASACYPSCRNVFGMHDSTASASETYAYTVCGWHSDPSHDPLASLSPEATTSALEKMRWLATGKATEAFAGTLYTGVVHSVRSGDAALPPVESPLTAVIGNTAAEANAALHTDRAHIVSDHFHTELQALLSGQLDRLSEPGGALKVARQFHQQRFSPATYGTLWYVMRRKDGLDVFAQLTPDQQAALAALNAAETLFSERYATAESLQWQLYADWCKYLRCRHPNPNTQEDLPKVDDVRLFIHKQSLEQSKDANAACKLAASEATQLFDALEKTLDPALLLERKPQTDTWRPVDPVLLLQGEDVRPALRFGGDGELGCQIFGGASEFAMLYRLDLNEGAIEGMSPASIDAGDAPSLTPRPERLGAPVAALQAAFVQSLLSWPLWAAAKLAQKAGKPDSTAAIEAWLTGSHTISPWSGTVPSSKSITLWSGNPWLPIMMHWDIVYEPLATVEPDAAAQGAFEAGAVVSRVADRLDSDDVDLVIAPGTASFLERHLLSGKLLEGDLDASLTSYSGITFITPQAGQRVRQQLQAYAPLHARGPLSAIAAHVNDIPVLSQTIGGFHDRLLLRRQTLQIDIHDPFAAAPEKKFIKEVRDAIIDLGSQVTTMAPIVQDRFSPMRGGDFMLKQIQLGDVFGQRRVFDSFQMKSSSAMGNRVVVAPALARRSGEQTLPSLPPRIAQAASLDFHWLCADHDAPLSSEDPAASPICGWIVPNFLENSMAIYDAVGESVGTIAIIESTLTWIGSPAHPETFGKSPREVLAGRNVHLRDFVLAMMARDIAALRHHLEGLELAVDGIQPLSAPQHSGIPNLVGQPLALTRASIKLRYTGTSAVNQTWGAFRRDIEQRKLLADQQNGSIQRTTNQHEHVQYPVVLGLSEDPDDGLVGFYKGGEGQERYNEIYLIAELSKPTAGIASSRVHTLVLSPDEPERIVTMLVDPRSPVAVTTGYTPAQVRALPPEAVKNAFARIAVTFLAAPVLTTEPPPASMFGSIALPVPLPGQQKGKWQWLSVQDKGDGRKAVYAKVHDGNSDSDVTASRIFLQEGWLSLSGFGVEEHKEDA